jgi:copper chaperone CopZ
MLRILWVGLALVAMGCRGGHPATADRSTAARESTATSVTAVSTPPRVVTLEVGGMTCASCVARVQHQLAAVPGVHSAKVSLDEQRALIVADAAVADTALTGAVRRAGPEFLGIVRR